jgi:ParB-like chromosome segregation protein Spo0J
MTEQYTNHPAADLFPMMQGKQWEEFKEDIRQNGFQESVTLYKNQILDGRNRYKAAIELDMLDDLPISEIDDDHQFDPFQWVISRNLHRRHLTESQRGMVAARLANIKHGHVASQKHDGPIGLSSIKQASEQLSVGERTTKRAKTVLDHGSPELIRAVDQGEIAVSRAATVAKIVPMEHQVYAAKDDRHFVDRDKKDRKAAIDSKKEKSIQVQRLELDTEWVRDFVHSMSRMNRLKSLLNELTDTERQIVKDWLATNV